MKKTLLSFIIVSTSFISCNKDYFIDVANNHHQALNELIHIACEQGVIGSLLFFTILFLVFKSYSPLKLHS